MKQDVKHKATLQAHAYNQYHKSVEIQHQHNIWIQNKLKTSNKIKNRIPYIQSEGFIPEYIFV